jgi:multidrug efflux pump subunit AcrA (membrane-fusion protein)
VARQTVDQAAAAFETAQSQVAVAQGRFGICRYRSFIRYHPCAVYRPHRHIAGKTGCAGYAWHYAVLNTISTGNPIGVDVVINEQDINRFYKIQQHASDTTFKLQLSDGTTYAQNGKIFAIDRGVNNQTGSIKVRVQFPNANDVLRDGMSCVLQVLNDNSGERVQIPYKAITEQMGEFFVFTVRDTTVKDTAADKTIKDRRDTLAHQVKVVLGQRIQSNVIIMQGVKPGDKVVTEGFQRLRDGGKVTQGPAAPVPGAAPKK